MHLDEIKNNFLKGLYTHNRGEWSEYWLNDLFENLDRIDATYERYNDYNDFWADRRELINDWLLDIERHRAEAKEFAAMVHEQDNVENLSLEDLPPVN